MSPKIKEFDNSGFGSDPSNFSNRLLNRDGSYNIKRKGVKRSDRFTIFHFLINTSWQHFFGYAILYYILVNFIFAFLYLLAGTHQLTGMDDGTIGQKFLQLFFFSSHTMTTVGYGNIYPIGNAAQIIAFFEAFVGLLSFAGLSGLFYGKISKPMIKIKFSDNAVIAPYKGGKGLMFRMASGMNSNFGETNAQVFLSRVETSGKRTFYGLDLEIDKIYMFVTSWTVVHPITEDSPFHHSTISDLAAYDAEILVHIKAFDETYSHEIMTRHSYKFDEIVDNAKFVNMHGKDEKGHALVEIGKLGDYELITEN